MLHTPAIRYTSTARKMMLWGWVLAILGVLSLMHEYFQSLINQPIGLQGDLRAFQLFIEIVLIHLGLSLAACLIVGSMVLGRLSPTECHTDEGDAV